MVSIIFLAIGALDLVTGFWLGRQWERKNNLRRELETLSRIPPPVILYPARMPKGIQ